MMLARKLNEHGIGEFRRHILALREGKALATPVWMLDDERTSSLLPLEIDIEQRGFSSRFEMGSYLSELSGIHDFQPLMGDTGFWSWLALYWFDQLCPPKKDGSRTASMHYNYILSRDYKHRPRHAVYITWQLVDRYGELARFLLSKEMPVRGEIIEQMMARQDMLSLEGVMRLASQLYTDPHTGHFKKGAASRKTGGCVSRFIIWLQQLERTHDLYSITDEELKGLLPMEFSRFQR